MNLTRTGVPTSTFSVRQTSTETAVYRLQLAITLALAVGSLLVVVLYLLLALTWLNQPFVGFLLNNALVINRAQPAGEGVWQGLAAGLLPGDRLVSINGVTLEPVEGDFAGARARYEDFRNRLRTGMDLEVQVRRGEAAELVTIPPYPVSQFTPLDWMVFFLIPYLAGVGVLVVGLAILWFRRTSITSLVAANLCFLMAMVMTGVFDIGTSHSLIRVWLLALMLTGGTAITLGMIFPERIRAVLRQPYLPFLPQGAALLAGVPLLLLYDRGPLGNFAQVSLVAVLTTLSGALIEAAMTFWHRRRALDRKVHDQATMVLVGFVLAATPAMLWVVAQIFGFQENLVPVEATMPFLITPMIGLAVAIFHAPQLDTDFVVSRSITYIVMFAGLVLGYFLLAMGASMFVTGLLPDNPLLIAVTLLVVAVGFVPVRSFLQTRIDAVYFRRRSNYQAKLETLAREISVVPDSSMLAAVKLFRQALNEGLLPESIFVFLPEARGGKLNYVSVGEKRPETDVIFSPGSGVTEFLQSGPLVHYLDPHQPQDPELFIDRARLDILNTRVLAALRTGEQLYGIVSIGSLQSRNPMTHEELRFIDSAARQLAVALARMRSIESLQSRVRELDVLSQIGQAVNFTIEFDDLLELISTRTGSLIDSRNFYIALYEPLAQQLYFAFYLENDERYADKENERWALGNDLFSQIVQTSQPRRVDDYVREVARGTFDAVYEPGAIHAWMGVPLIAGANTLGAMAVASSRAGEVYTDDQLRVFNNIGALAASSIERGRLFSEVNVRARQLAALNDISQKLVVAEAGQIEPLLELITRSAADILNCEAGSLLLRADDDSGDMVFRVVIGGTGSDLIGTRVKSGRGLVGEVAKTARYAISNETGQDTRWKGEIAKTGEFRTNSILAVPLIAKDQVIGVLEVLNKKDGTRFVDEEVELLTTFAGQAAIAIENTRLFQMTGTMLNERLEQLETLEKIDFELNRSLDITRVAEITVRWAVASSGAVAGAMGLVEGAPPHLRIVSKYGYRDDEVPEGADGMRWPLDRGIVRRVLRTLRPDLADTKIDPDYVPSLKGAISQLTIPMVSGDEPIAILILETNKEPRFKLLDQQFVTRIAEHSTIAVSNALLLGQLQFAAESKSEFVGFAAHELKNPLTSIKGYAGILNSGMAASMSDEQRLSAVNVIVSNADRMQAIIDDLRDVAALEANKLKMAIEPLAFHTVVDETLIGFTRSLEDKDQKIDNRITPDLPLVMADKKRMIQVFTNLVSNAHKYSPESTTITLSAEVNPNFRTRQGELLGPMLHVRVQDQGIGMNDEDLARIFREDYFRSNNEKARAQKGTGLGMMITQRFVEGHGGRIWVESTLDVGSTFHFVLPLAPTKPADPTNGAEPAETHRAPTQIRPGLRKTDPSLLPSPEQGEPASD